MRNLFIIIFLIVSVACAQPPPDPIAVSTNNATKSFLQSHPNVTTVRIFPSATDPAIKTFDLPHSMYVNREIIVDHKEGLTQDRHELLLWITGTHMLGTTNVTGAGAFCMLAADLGYHVIALMYPNDKAAATVRNVKDPDAFEEFRLAIIKGGQTPYIAVEQCDSIENRLVKLLLHLKSIRPREHWEQFLDDDGSIKWETIAVAGQSQGGGHAALIGIKHKVARVICTGSPKDYNQARRAPAAWYRQTSATPKERFFTFNHQQDSMGFTTPKQWMENLQALGLDAFGPPVVVDAETAPYRHTRILLTSFPSVNVTSPESEASLAAHVSVIANKNAERWAQVWTYMLTEKTR
jgi:hypothetical protein